MIMMWTSFAQRSIAQLHKTQTFHSNEEKVKKGKYFQMNKFNFCSLDEFFVCSFVGSFVRSKNKFIIINWYATDKTDRRIYLFSVFMKTICSLCSLSVFFAHFSRMFSSQCHILYPFEVSRPYFGILCLFDRGLLNIIRIYV